jgi:HD-like signal output (HDOD) protein
MTQSFDPRELEALVRGLPVGPAILARLHSLLKNPGVSAVDIVLAVRIDPALATAVLRVARSPMFAGEKPPETLDEAVVRIGFKEVSRIVSYTAMQQLAESLPIYGESADFFWRKSVACAMAMEMLTSRAGQPPEPAYLIGLLHSIGAILLHRMAVRLAPAEFAIAPESSEGVAAQEIRNFGMHQGAAAANALATWEFPQADIRPIECQFEPAQAGEFSASAMQLVVAKHLSLLALDRPARARAVEHYPGGEQPELVAELKERVLMLDEVAAAAGATT